MGRAPDVLHFAAIARCRWFVLATLLCAAGALASPAAAQRSGKSGAAMVRHARTATAGSAAVQPWWSQLAWSFFVRRPPVRRLAGVVQGSITTDGTAVQVTIANAGDTAELSFGCTAGDRVTMSFSGTIEAGTASIVRPDGTNAASSTWFFHSGGFFDVTPLNQTGTCLVRLVPSNNFTGMSRTGFDGDRVSWFTRPLRRA